MTQKHEQLSLIRTLPLANALGECVLWDHRSQKIYWTDILNKKLFSHSLDGETTAYNCPEKLCSFGLSLDPLWFICAFESGFAFFKPTTQDIIWINKVTAEQANVRLNDGRVDRQGRFWAGSMLEVPNENQGLGSLYRLNFDGSLSEQISQVEIANSLCWSPDSATVYFADSPKRCIQNASFDRNSGEIGELQDFVHTAPQAYPDGACIDSEGCLWSAQWASSTVKRYSPKGELLLTLAVPCKQPSCVAFVGKKLNYLCVTSATQDLSTEQITEHEGNLFIYKTPFTGLAEAICLMPVPNS